MTPKYDIVVKSKVLECLPEVIMDMKHDVDVNHGEVIIDERKWYEPALGKCTKCSMMFFAASTLTRELVEYWMERVDG